MVRDNSKARGSTVLICLRLNALICYYKLSRSSINKISDFNILSLFKKPAYVMLNVGTTSIVLVSKTLNGPLVKCLTEIRSEEPAEAFVKNDP